MTVYELIRKLSVFAPDTLVRVARIPGGNRKIKADMDATNVALWNTTYSLRENRDDPPVAVIMAKRRTED